MNIKEKSLHLDEDGDKGLCVVEQKGAGRGWGRDISLLQSEQREKTVN